MKPELTATVLAFWKNTTQKISFYNLLTFVYFDQAKNSSIKFSYFKSRAK